MKTITVIFSGLFFLSNVYAEIPANAKYAGNCALSLSMGKTAQTDCTVNWADPKGTGTYCFSNEEAKAAWSKDPINNMIAAEKVYAKNLTDGAMKQAGEAMNQANKAMDQAMKDMAKAQQQMPNGIK